MWEGAGRRRYRAGAGAAAPAAAGEAPQSTPASGPARTVAPRPHTQHFTHYTYNITHVPIHVIRKADRQSELKIYKSLVKLLL